MAFKKIRYVGLWVLGCLLASISGFTAANDGFGAPRTVELPVVPKSIECSGGPEHRARARVNQEVTFVIDGPCICGDPNALVDQIAEAIVVAADQIYSGANTLARGLVDGSADEILPPSPGANFQLNDTAEAFISMASRQLILQRGFSDSGELSEENVVTQLMFRERGSSVQSFLLQCKPPSTELVLKCYDSSALNQIVIELLQKHAAQIALASNRQGNSPIDAIGKAKQLLGGGLEL